MATTDDEAEIDATPARWHVRGRTTIELRQRGPDEWLATQRGVDVEGRGDSAAAAAAAYCRTVDGGGDVVAGENDPGP